MSKKKQAAAGAVDGMVEVRALKDDEAYGLVAGMAASIAAELVEPLKAAGAVDDHPDAVAYAKSQAA